VNIGIMGAGAVGCYYGALLAAAGHGVTLVGRPAFVESVRSEGLRVESADSDAVVRPAVATGPAALAGAEVVLVCVKSADTEAVGRALAPHLRPDCAVFSFQNGVDNAERLAAVMNRLVTPVVLYVAVEMAGPGHVRHLGRGDVIFGSSVHSEALAAVFRAAGVEATVSADVVQALWGKLITNCAYNALSAVAQLPYGSLLAVTGVAEVMADVAAECVAVGRGLGIALPDPDPRRILGLAATMPGQYSSTAQDLARHKPTEIDHLNGHIVRKGMELGIATPANRALYAMVRLLESKSG
jgi:2-dehydropantoate 2-reductase